MSNGAGVPSVTVPPAEAQRPQFDFFISYTQADEDFAIWIADWLELARYQVTYQKGEFRPGENFVLRMQDATRAAKKTILVFPGGFE
jgi:hypothetical protein